MFLSTRKLKIALEMNLKLIEKVFFYLFKIMSTRDSLLSKDMLKINILF